MNKCLSWFLAERGKGHDCQNEPTEDQFCHTQQRPLDRPALLQPPGRQPDLQGDEEDGEEISQVVHTHDLFVHHSSPGLREASELPVEQAGEINSKR